MGKRTLRAKIFVTFYKMLFQNLYLCYNVLKLSYFTGLTKTGEGNKGDRDMKRIKTLTTRDLKESMKKGGCGECQTSCQSACKTSCTVGNQSCEKVK